jgi:vacuolar-type H+-ATPase subunit D/Vma8
MDFIERLGEPIAAEYQIAIAPLRKFTTQTTMKGYNRLQAWVQWVRHRVWLWMVLTIASVKLPWLCGIERTKEQADLAIVLTQINLARWLELAQEVVDDLPYWFY